MGTCGPVEAHTGAFDTLVFYQAVYCSHIVCNVLYQYCKGLGHLGVDAKRIESVVRGGFMGKDQTRMVWTQEFPSEVWASLPARRPMMRRQHKSGTKKREGA